ncbi:MAG: fused MFS/spermidine synthase [Hyphomicrobiaceae bacterium]
MNSGYSLKLIIAGVSAACGLIVEIVAGRMIAPYLGMSLYTWTAIISVVLAGFSVGHWVGGLIAERPAKQALKLVAWSLLLASASTALSLILIRVIGPLIIAQGWSAVPTVLMVTLLLFFLPSFFVGIPSPVLTKLAIDNCSPSQVGRAIGAFFAVGAVGSIVGTLAAGFIFIAWLGITKTLLLVAIVYFALGLLLIVPRSISQIGNLVLPFATVVVGTGILAYVGNRVNAFTETCKIGSSYYCIRVIDVSQQFEQPSRLMVLDHLGHGVNLQSEPQKLVSPYVELQDVLARIHSGQSSPFRTFFVGGGAYTLPRAWAAARPDAEITVAEIDPVVTQTAHSELWLKKTPRITTLIDDARNALRQSPDRSFDVIVGDAFHDIVIPPHLVTHEFFELVAARLKKDGIYLMTVVDHRHRPRLALSIYRTLQSVLERIEIWVSNEPGVRSTFVLAAVREATPYSTLPSRNSPGVHFLRLERSKIERHAKKISAMVLSDDHAPVDHLIGVQ